jgi:hypothetical protein
MDKINEKLDYYFKLRETALKAPDMNIARMCDSAILVLFEIKMRMTIIEKIEKLFIVDSLNIHFQDGYNKALKDVMEFLE